MGKYIPKLKKYRIHSVIDWLIQTSFTDIAIYNINK